jgi:hypothetical protein
MCGGKLTICEGFVQVDEDSIKRLTLAFVYRQGPIRVSSRSEIEVQDVKERDLPSKQKWHLTPSRLSPVFGVDNAR